MLREQKVELICLQIKKKTTKNESFQQREHWHPEKEEKVQRWSDSLRLKPWKRKDTETQEWKHYISFYLKNVVIDRQKNSSHNWVGIRNQNHPKRKRSTTGLFCRWSRFEHVQERYRLNTWLYKVFHHFFPAGGKKKTANMVFLWKFWGLEVGREMLLPD